MSTDVLRGYSNPLEPFDEAFHWHWVVLVYTARVCEFLTRFGPALDGSSRGVRELLQRATSMEVGAAGADPARMFWHPFASLASLAQAETTHPDGVTARALQFALRFAEEGGAFDLEARLGTPVRLGFDRFLLPPFTRLSMQGAGDERALQLDGPGGSSIEELRRVGGAWQLVRGRAQEQPTVVCGAQRITVFPHPRSALSPDPDVITATPAMVEVLQAALDLIVRYSASHATWVQRLLRVVIPLRLVPGQYNSETFSAVNGAVIMSLQDDVVRTADTLIHEVSHDYLHVVETMERLVTSEDELFYSPPRRTERSTRRILSAHHAFANILIFYYLLDMSGVPLDGYYVRGIEKLEGWRRHFESCLERSAVLTEAAERVWRPLARRAQQLQGVRAALVAARLGAPGGLEG